MRLLVDGTNVMGSRPDGWWRDRPGATRRLVTKLVTLGRGGDYQITVVFDGPPLAQLPGTAAPICGEAPVTGDPVVRVGWARRSGPDAADDRIVELLEADPNAGAVTVVTSDRRLGQRAKAAGAGLLGARWLWERLDRLPPGPEGSELGLGIGQ